MVALSIACASWTGEGRLSPVNPAIQFNGSRSMMITTSQLSAEMHSNLRRVRGWFQIYTHLCRSYLHVRPLLID